MATQPQWSATPRRLMMIACPDCDQIEYVELTHHVSRTAGGLSVVVRPVAPVAHHCETSEAA